MRSKYRQKLTVETTCIVSHMDVKVSWVSYKGASAKDTLKEKIHQRCNVNFLSGLALIAYFGDLDNDVSVFKKLGGKWVPMTEKELLNSLSPLLVPDDEGLTWGQAALYLGGVSDGSDSPVAYCNSEPEGKFLAAINWLKEEIYPCLMTELVGPATEEELDRDAQRAKALRTMTYEDLAPSLSHSTSSAPSPRKADQFSSRRTSKIDFAFGGTVDVRS